MDESFKKQAETPSPFGDSGGGAEIDVFKKMLIDTNPILLITTFVVRSLSADQADLGIYFA
jgi:hypothetical protein